jgi:Uncharacterized protein related to plant photosystem II stability/assembly factor
VTMIFPVDEHTVFLFGSDKKKVINERRPVKEQSALFFRSLDGGRTFEKQVLGKGELEYISRSADQKTFYIGCARFSERDDRKPGNFEILRSTDLGAGWEGVYLFEDKLVDKVLFFNDSLGFVSVIQDTLGYDLPALYRTEDGGKTWKSVRVNMDNRSLNVITSTGKILGRYLDDTPGIWELDVHDLSLKEVPLEIPAGLSLSGFIRSDPVTGRHYCKLRTTPEDDESGKKIEYGLICVETGEIIKLPSPSYHFYVYGDFIVVRGVCRENRFMARYRFSYNKGRTWQDETPLSARIAGPPGFYGKGYVWSWCSGEADGKYCPLLVRIPPEEDR